MWGRRRRGERLSAVAQAAQAAHQDELRDARQRKAQADRLTIRADKAASRIRDATGAFTEAMAHALQGRP